MTHKPYTKDLKSLVIADVGEVGGKNASLGEMIQKLEPKGVNLPGGFVVTATAYRYFVDNAKFGDQTLKAFIKSTLKSLNIHDLKNLSTRGELVRNAILHSKVPEDLEKEIIVGYKKMEKQYFKNVDVAVRSSATAEDLPGASFAGQQETYLNISGAENVLKSVHKCFASLFTDRAIVYRQDRGFDHLEVALSVGIQKMVRSDKGASGVIFTVDTESGFKDLIIVNAAWGLGEMVVQGEVIPDEYLVFKPFLNQKKLVPIIDKKIGSKDRKMIYADKSSSGKSTKIISTSQKEKESYVLNEKEILTLARWSQMIEDHYTQVHHKWTPMDLEWAKDGVSGKLYIIQARPETVQAKKDYSRMKEFIRLENGKILCKGLSVGTSIASGKAHIIMDVKDIQTFKKGEVLVTDMTDPDWEPIMKIASAIVTDKGGRTSHAAIVSRELGIPCIVGSETATKSIKNNQTITVDTTGSEGFVFDGSLDFKVVEHDIKKIPKISTKILMNIATPDTAFEKSFLPNEGVGLAREEFIIASNIGIHPMALIDYKNLKSQTSNPEIKKILSQIDKKTAGYKDKKEFYVDKLASGIAKIGAAFYPKDVIVRFSDFKTNEYRQLIGGELYEPQEENPMIGWRGASRYYHPSFAQAFILEVKAIKKVRKEMGLSNVQVMIPVCRTVEEGKKVIALIEKNGLERKSGLKIYVMCEIPSNIILADKFLDIFDGMSIGSNDLTQMTLGIDRDGNERIRSIANENNEAIKILISQVIKKCTARGKYVGICGQAPSDYPEFAKFLVDEGIYSMSLNPDSVIKTIMYLAKHKGRN